MKKIFLTLTIAAITLRTSVAFAAESAPVTLTIQSFRALTNTVATLAEAAVPGSAGDVLNDMQDGFGREILEAVDIERPWQIGIWMEGIGGRPAASLWIPAKDFDALKSALESGPLLAGLGDNPSIAANGNYAAVFLPGPSSSASAQTSHAAWTAARLGKPGAVATLDLQPGDALRQELLQGLGFLRMTLAGAIGSQSQETLQGMDPAALSQVLGVYLDVLEVGFKGMEKLNVQLTVGQDALQIRDQVTALTGSELATWLKGGQGDLSGVLRHVNAQAPAVLAMRWDEAPAYMPLLKKLMGLSLQLQGATPGSEAITETERLIELMAPMQSAGNVDFENGLAFAFVYEFPGRDVKEIYRLMTGYLEKSMQSQVGEGKAYKAITFKEGQRQVAGLSVDRLTMEVNLDAPMYQSAGQKEMLEGMWPGGKMEFDYAIQGDKLLVASPERLEQLLQPTSPAPPTSLGMLRPATVFAARVNVLKLIPQFLKSNPMVPEETRQQFDQIDSKGTEVLFQLDLDGSLKGEATVPLQLIRSVSQAF